MNSTAVRSRFLFGLVLAVIASVFWGAMGVCVQFLFEKSSITPIDLVSIRLILSGSLLVLINLFLNRRKLLAIFKSRKAVLGIGLSGCEVLSAHLTFFLSIYYSNAGTGAIFLALVPLIAGFYLYLRGRKSFTGTELFCCALAFFGVTLIVSKGDFNSFDFSWLAVFWGLVSAVMAAVYSIQPRPLIDRWGVEPVVSWGILTAGVVGILIAQPWEAIASIEPQGWLAVAFIVVFGTVAAFWMYLESLKYLTPVIVGLVVCLEPLSAFVFGVCFMGLQLGWLECLGIFMVLANVVILSIKR